MSRPKDSPDVVVLDMAAVPGTSSHRITQQQVTAEQDSTMILKESPSAVAQATAQCQWALDLAIRVHHSLWQEADILFRVSLGNDRILAKAYEDCSIGVIRSKRLVALPDGSLQLKRHHEDGTRAALPAATWELSDCYKHAYDNFRKPISHLVNLMRTKFSERGRRGISWIWEPLSSAISAVPKPFDKADLTRIVSEVVLGYGKFALRVHILNVAVHSLANAEDGVDDPYEPGIMDTLVMGCIRDLYGLEEYVRYGATDIVELDAIYYALHQRRYKLAASRITSFVNEVEGMFAPDRLGEMIPLAANLASKIGKTLCEACYSFPGSESYYPDRDDWLPPVDWKPESMGPVTLWPDNDEDPNFLRKYDPYVELPLAKQRLSIATTSTLREVAIKVDE